MTIRFANSIYDIVDSKFDIIIGCLTHCQKYKYENIHSQ